jgi:hypothetical protein
MKPKYLDKKTRKRKRKQKGGAEKDYPAGDLNKRISYTGNLNNEGIPDGIGRMIYERTDSYNGTWRDGKRDGPGTMSYHNYRDPNITDMYNGEWKDDKQNGQGKMMFYAKYNETLPDTFYYEGEWKDNKENGKGRHIWENGDYYETKWEDGDAATDGKLRMTLENGDIYEGQVHNYDVGDDWDPKLPNGKGKMIYTDGTVYDGEWENGERYNGLEVDVWTSDADCENNADIEDPTSLEQIPIGRGFRVEAEYIPDENKGRCYDAEQLIQIKNGITPLTRAPFTEVDKTRMKAYVRSKNALPFGGKSKKSRKGKKGKKSRKTKQSRKNRKNKTK